MTAYIIPGSGRVITDSVFKRYSVPSILDKHKGILWLQFINRYSPPSLHWYRSQTFEKLEMMVWYGAGWKYTLQKLGIVSIAELCKAGRDFSAEPDTRTNVLSFPLGVYIFL